MIARDQGGSPILPEADPRHEKFARLTSIEEKWGLYEETKRIGTREGWREVLMKKGVELRGQEPSATRLSEGIPPPVEAAI